MRMHWLDFRPCNKSSFRSQHFEISCFVDRHGEFGGFLHRGSVSTVFTRLACLEEDNTKPREKGLVSTPYFASKGVVHLIYDMGLSSVKPS